MALQTRKPTGLPSWPITLLSGLEKNGKSYAAAQASASAMVGRTFWIGCGEDDPDEYGAIEGARFEIVDHDGTHKGMLGAIRDAVAEPAEDGKPNLIVLDSATRWWDMLSKQAQEAANRRAKKAAEKYSRPFSPDDEATIHPDLWNAATSQWYEVVDALREHQGPVIVTALLAENVVMDDAGRPTKDRIWKVKGQKNLPADVGVVVEIPAYRECYVTGVRSVRREPVKVGDHTADTRFDDFTVEKLWLALGLDGEVGTRAHAGTSTADHSRLVAEVAQLAAERNIGAQVAQEWRAAHDGQHIKDATDVAALTALRDSLLQRDSAPVEQPAAPAPQQAAPSAPPVEQAPRQEKPAEQQQAHTPPPAFTGPQLESIIVGQAETLGLNPKEYVAPLVSMQANARTVRDLPMALVSQWVTDKAADVIAHMRNKGLAAFAQAYEESVRTRKVGTFDDLIDPRTVEQQDRAAAQPEGAHAQR